MMIKLAFSNPVSIFIAGDAARAGEICRAHCDEVGLCVTVTPTTYVYTGGEEAGVIVGLINYPRFPSDPEAIRDKAEALGRLLLVELGQESFTVQTPEQTLWFSERHADNALAPIETGTAETQSGSVRSMRAGNSSKRIRP